MGQPELWLERGQIDEVACLSAPEDCQNLVDRELLGSEDKADIAPLGYEQPRVGGEVDTCLVDTVGHEEAREPVADVLLAHDQARRCGHR